MSRINTKVDHTVYLGQGGIGDKLIIGTAGYIQPTAAGAAGVVSDVAGAKIVNHGTVFGGSNGMVAGGVGIDLQASGTIINSGSVNGGFGGYARGGDGVDLGSDSVLINRGVVAGGGGYSDGIGVLMTAADTVTNDGTIVGGNGQYAYHGGSPGAGGAGVAVGAGSMLTNTGTIDGGVGGYAPSFGAIGGAGVDLLDGASAINRGMITGGEGGAAGGNGGAGVSLSGGTFTNTANIHGGMGGVAYYGGAAGGTGGAGVVLSGGMFTNSGNIDGGMGGDQGYGFNTGAAGVGVSILGGTLTNSGTISGASGSRTNANGDAVKFGTAAATLVVDPRAVFVGNVVGDGKNDTLVLAAGSHTGHLDGLGGAGFSGFATVIESAGAVWTLTGATNLGAGTKLDAAGTLTFSGDVAGGGSMTLDSGSTVIAAGSLGVGAVVFGAGGAELLTLGAPAAVTSTLSGFGAGDTIDLVKLLANGVSFANGTLSLLENNSVVASLTLAGNYTSANFTLTTDGHGGTDIGYVTQGAKMAPTESGWVDRGVSHEMGWAAGHLAGPGDVNWGLVVAEHGHFII